MARRIARRLGSGAVEALLTCGVALGAVGGCLGEEALCLRPVRNWEERLLDEAAIRAEIAALPKARAMEMYEAGCRPAPVGVDARNGTALFARPYCDDNCPDPEDWTVALFYGVASEEECAAIWGCGIIGGGSTTYGGCVPEGGPMNLGWYTRCLAPCPEPVTDYSGVTLDVPGMRVVAEPYAERVVPHQLECPPAPIGVDSRNGATVYLEHDWDQAILTYGPESEGDWVACETLGACWVKVSEGATELHRCAPVAAPDYLYDSGCF